MAHSGSVKPFPDGPVPCVWPVNTVEALRLADGRKLVGWVEKHRKRSLRCNFPAYRLPGRPTSLARSPCFAAVDEECGIGSTSSAVISCRGFCESGRRNCSRKRDALEGFRSEDGEVGRAKLSG